MAPRIAANVTIWENILPTERYERYEEPLLAVLDEAGRGELLGSGSGLSPDGSIDFVDIQLELDDDDDVFADVIQVLTERGAPKGSTLECARGGEERIYDFGEAEGIELMLAGMADEDEGVAFVDDVQAATSHLAGLRRVVVVRNRTTFYFYGPDAEEHWRALEPLVRASPLCRGATATLRCGHPDGQPRAVTLEG